MITDRTWKMAQVAKMYYIDNLTQEEIAEKINISRSTISRLLDAAKTSGIIEVKVHFPWQRVEELENALCKKYNLKAVRVLQATEDCSTDVILEGLGVLAARYFEEIVQPNTIVAITSGRGAFHTVNALSKQNLNLTVVQMMGAANCENPLIDGPELAQLMVSRMGGRYTYLQVPFLINPELYQTIYLEKPYREIVTLIKKADYAIIGVGSVDPVNSSLLRTGFSSEALAELTRCGAIGEICGQPFDRIGQLVTSNKIQRAVSIELKYLKGIPTVIGVAGELYKTESIRGSLLGRLLNVLITNQKVAEQLLNN
jgi:DNA-binding transcriptional regulator LsrR (DeoR family)